MPTRNVNLSEQQAKFIRQSIGDGRYRNASEVVRAGLRVLEHNERQDKLKLQALRRLTKQAFDDIDRGRFEAVDPDRLDEFIARVDSTARASRT
jgi:antitoxin ParD1/3/4